MALADTEIPASCPPGWAHEIGALSLGPVPTVPTSLADIADRLLIQESAARYALAYDERRLDVLRDVLTEDVTFAYSISGGGYGEYVGREVVVAWLHDVMEGQSDQRRHLCSNFIVEELTVDHAVATTYFALFASAAETALVTTGFYRMRMRKEAGRWRIAHVYDGLDRPF